MACGVDRTAHYNGSVSTRIKLTAGERTAFERLAADITRVFRDRFVALTASGRHSSVAFVASITAHDLEALGPLSEVWHRDGLDTPLLLTSAEFRRSLDAFPVEYQALLDRHEVIAGHPPFDDLAIDPANLRRACEVQAKSHLIHIRQGWIEAAGHDDRLADLIIRSAEPLRALLADVARLHGRVEDDAALAGARVARLDDTLIREVLAADTAPGNAHRVVRRLPDYLAASEQLWLFVDSWSS
jgi:hypothetical protein